MNSIARDPARFVLTLNAGSSSLKFALFRFTSPVECVATGKIEGIGQPAAKLSFKTISTGTATKTELGTSSLPDCLAAILKALQPLASVDALVAVGHRVVHGGPRYNIPQAVTADLLKELCVLSPLDPEHLPVEIELIEAFQSRCPKVPQVACFDTAFHHDLPRLSKMLPIPRHYEESGVRRYGFHGLSYQFLMEELLRLGDPAAKTGRVVLAHLGNGASMAAVREGKCIDTSMSFTPTAGLIMGTRSGDLDPGLAAYLARTEKMTAAQFQNLINHQSGLLGISGLSADMRVLLEEETRNPHAAEAVNLFCYQAKKWLGAFIAALGGIDTIVFAGGIGENCPEVRRRICEGLDFIGINVDKELNAQADGLISAARSCVSVRVIHTDEEAMIARSVATLLSS